MSEAIADPSPATSPPLVRAPFFHFLLLGLATFGIYAWLQDDAPTSVRDPEVIQIDAEEIGALADGWLRTRGRPPSRAELEGLVRARIREEILSREAIAMGMDQGDPVIRRMLAQKVDMLVGNITSMREPTEADLQSYLTEHPDAFRVHPRIRFEQRYFNPEKHRGRLDEDVAAALEALRSGTTEVGDASMLPADLPLADEAEIARIFGTGFARDMLALEGDGWQGPVASSYGPHLVRILERSPGRRPPLEEIRPLVAQAVRDQQSRKAAVDLYEQLKARYDITIDTEAIAAAANE